MAGLEYVRPESMQECVSLLSGARAPRVLNGGTDLLVDMRRRPESWERLGTIVDIKGVQDQWCITSGEDSLRIGGCVTYAQLIASTSAQGWAPLLVDACRAVGDPQIRNRGTLGGNAVTASPAGDALVALLALDARVELASTRGVREVPIGDFIIGPKRTTLGNDEVLSALLIPGPAHRGGFAFGKVGRRKALMVAIVNIAVQLSVHGGLIAAAAIALGAVAPTPVRATEAEKALRGEKPSAELFKTAADLALTACQPIDDIRASAAGRRALLAGLLISGLRDASEKALRCQA